MSEPLVEVMLLKVDTAVQLFDKKSDVTLNCENLNEQMFFSQALNIEQHDAHQDARHDRKTVDGTLMG